MFCACTVVGVNAGLKCKNDISPGFIFCFLSHDQIAYRPLNPLLPGNTDKCIGLVVNTGNQQLLSKTQLGAAMVGVECSGKGKEPAAYIRIPGEMCIFHCN